MQVVAPLELDMSSEDFSVFRRVNKVPLHVMCKSKPEAWASPTLLLRCLTKSNNEVCIVATGDAMTFFDKLDLSTPYVVDLPGPCVKPNKTGAKHGVSGDFEVRLMYAPKLTVAVDVWPMKVPYQCTEFQDLNKVEANHFVDIVGVVKFAGAVNTQSTLAKREVYLQNEVRELNIITYEFDSIASRIPPDHSWLVGCRWLLRL